MARIRVQTGDFDAGAELAALAVGRTDVGGIGCFIGTVRGGVGGRALAALEATSFLIDWLKTKAPFWKKEELADGSADWVAARAGDEAAASRWGRTEQGLAPGCASGGSP